MLIELKQLNIKNDNLELFIKEKSDSFYDFLGTYIMLYRIPKDFIIVSKYKNKLKDNDFYKKKDIKIFKEENILNLYKEEINFIFEKIKQLKKIDYSKIKKMKKENVFIYHNHKEKHIDGYENYDLYQLNFLIIFIELLNEGYSPINHRIIFENNQYKHIIYYI